MSHPPQLSAFAAFLAARRRTGNEGISEPVFNNKSSQSKTAEKKINANESLVTKESQQVSSSSSQSIPLISPHKTNTRSISLLPQHVIDQIAAGEVVQRPVSVVKELLENSLDAGATHIIVHVEKGGLSKLSITDNGYGIAQKDLPLLATRHATSKLTSVDDFSTLATFGFRGEAIAATSMVSRLLTVTTRRAESPIAYTQSYQNGKPCGGPCKPCARTVGTTLVVHDMFYNVPHRLQAYSKRESEEYAKILSVVQQYAIHYPTVGFVCQRTRSSERKSGGSNNLSVIVDCNTTQIVKDLSQSQEESVQKSNIVETTKKVLSHIMEANLLKHLMHFQCGNIEDSVNDGQCTSPNYRFKYCAQVYCTTPDYHTINRNISNKKQQSTNQPGKFILFLNDRLVDLPPLKRAMEDVYADFTTGTGGVPASSKTASSITSKPVLLVNLTIPGSQVDVNVHPSKKQVALMYQEDIVDSLARELRKQLEGCGQTFSTHMSTSTSIRNPYAKENRDKKRKDPPQSSGNGIEVEKSPEKQEGMDKDVPTQDSTTNKAVVVSSGANDNTVTSDNSTSKKPKIAPSKMIRTNKAMQAGAIEPFLTSTQSDSALSTTTMFETTTPKEKVATFQNRRHLPDCPLSLERPIDMSKLDLSQPGAFVTAVRCTCQSVDARAKVLVKQQQTTVRCKRVIPTACTYVSVKSLRKRIHKQQCLDTTKELRQAFFVGVLSHQRSLIQCGEQLVMINHMELAKELFYQLALARFGGGAEMAHLGEMGSNGGIDVQKAIEHALQLEDNLVLVDNRCTKTDEKMLDVNVTNRKLAKQATAFLLEHAGMLQDYFSIRIEQMDDGDFKEDNDEQLDNNVHAILKGLPVLLDGHSPPPHGLPIFLLRLANQIDYSEELPCFHGICKELGNYYAMLPSVSKDDLNSFVRHNLFPAISYLLLPSEKIPAEGNFTVMTKLSTLFKAFERC